MPLISTAEPLILAGLESLSDADFAHFCARNRKLQIERYAAHDIRLVRPTPFLTSRLTALAPTNSATGVTPPVRDTSANRMPATSLPRR